MPEDDPVPDPKLPSSAEQLIARVASREARMIRTKREGAPNPWRAAALIGLIGWSVVLPMLIGIAIGTWIDHRWPSRFSWTLMLLVAGLGAGCLNAWNRIKQEQEDR
jgi:ATP synthase protein I